MKTLRQLNRTAVDEFDHVVMEDLVDALDHGILVSNLAYFLSKELQMSEKFCYELAVAGMIHDVGKLVLSKYLYARKKEVLQIEEMKYVRMHSTFSYNILCNRGYSKFILEAIYHHHENYDGTGYPDNLKEQEIPWGARILRVCDVFAALVSNRPYREAFDTDTAMELMIEEVKNFDMRVFLAFQRLIHSDEFEEIIELVEKTNERNRVLNELSDKIGITELVVKHS